MLRDRDLDRSLGYFNIGRDEAQRFGFRPGDRGGEGVERWLRERLDLIDECLRAGWRRIRAKRSLRIKLIVHLYCCRYRPMHRRLRRHGLGPACGGPPGPADVLRSLSGALFLLAEHLGQRLRPW
jgi:hypothetical protein